MLVLEFGGNDLSNTEPAQKKPVIGLIGGIGAGKSSVARILESLGAVVLDSDRQTHELYRDPEVKRTVCQWWGDRVLDPGGEVDRRAIASIVFKTPVELTRLEGLLYPRLARWRDERTVALQADARVSAIVLDAPKLYEAGLNRLCDVVVYVDSRWVDRVRRVADGRGWTEKQLSERENLLKPLDQKRAIADYVVENHADLAALRAETQRVFSMVLEAHQRDESNQGS